MAENFISIMDPVNNSGVQAVCILTFDEDSLTIDVAARGLEPDQPHPFHIHGLMDDSPSVLPTIDRDADLDGFVEGSEAAPLFGPVLIHFTAAGDEAAATASLDEYPVADSNGEIEFSRTYVFDFTDPDQAAIHSALSARMEGRGIQFHGDNLRTGEGAGTSGEVNGTGGYVAGVPVANGIIHDLPFNPEILDTVGISVGTIADYLFA